MNIKEVSRKEWEAATGFDESENFTYPALVKRGDELEEEWSEADGDDAIIRFEVNEEIGLVTVSAHGFGPNLTTGHNFYQQPDGWCELAEWTFGPVSAPEAYAAAVKLGKA